MSSCALALLVSALCAAGSSWSDEAMAAASIPLPLEFAEGALAPAPTKVVLRTSYYGTVTLDHQAHLKRRAHCRDCHGPGVVSQIAFTPKLAHDRCRGCHQELARGPTDCKGCHVKPPEPSATALAAATPAGSPGAVVNGQAKAGDLPPAPASSTGGPWTPASLPAGAATSPAATAELVLASAAEREARALHRTVQVGGDVGADGYGLSARLVSRQESEVLSFGLDRLGGGGPTRTALLVGAGTRLPVRMPPSLGLFAEGVVGLDVVTSPSVDFLPALGARLGLEWTPRWASSYPLLLSVTGLLDAFHGSLLSPACLFATVGVGAPLAPR